MKTLTLPAPAKLNLFLHILGKRSDGYHELQTFFQLLDYGDELEFEINEDGTIDIEAKNIDCALEDNLIWQASQLIKQELVNQGRDPLTLGAKIKVNKRLPMGGGVGGGSSDAATTLLGLNALWQGGLKLNRMREIGLKLGADVPIFVSGQSALAEGIGEHLKPIEYKEIWYLVIRPNCHISTKDVFSHPDLTRGSSPIKIRAFLTGEGQNDCQALVRKLYPEVDLAIKDLSSFAEAKLTGTGSCVFAAFTNKAEAQVAYRALCQPNDDADENAQNTRSKPKVYPLSGVNYEGFVAKGCQQSPLHLKLKTLGHNSLD